MKTLSARSLNDRAAKLWTGVGTRFLPFADVATAELPLGRLLRLSLFQVSVGMATVLLIGTLNRVMIVEMGMAAWLVALMVALPLLFAPFRALIGYRSDTYRWGYISSYNAVENAPFKRVRDYGNYEALKKVPAGTFRNLPERAA